MSFSLAHYPAWDNNLIRCYALSLCLSLCSRTFASEGRQLKSTEQNTGSQSANISPRGEYVSVHICGDLHHLQTPNKVKLQGFWFTFMFFCFMVRLKKKTLKGFTVNKWHLFLTLNLVSKFQVLSQFTVNSFRYMWSGEYQKMASCSHIQTNVSSSC